MTIDPVTLQVIGGALHTIAREMAYVLYRMSFSSIIRESEDLGAGLFDRQFATLCESDNTPLHIGSIPGYLRGIDATMTSLWREGDVVIHNHPYFGASHSPDIAVVVPVFFEGRHVGFAANTAHHVDIGSATPGLIVDIQDIFGEGMLLKAVKLYEAGVRNDTVWNYLRDNSRVGRQLQDDLGAQIASAQLGARRFRETLRHLWRRDRRGGLGRADGLYRAHAPAEDRRDPRRRLLRRELARRRRPQPQCPPADQGLRAHPRRRGRGRPDRLLAAGADRLQRAVRGLDQGRLLRRLPLAAARYLHRLGADPGQ